MPPSVTITLFEKVTYLRGQSASNDAGGGRFRHRRNVLDQDSQPSQLRGLVTLHIPKPTRIKSVELCLSGQGRTDWPEGIGNNRVELAETTQFFKEQITLFDAKAEAAPAPPLRRSHSVGPGIGLTDDVDWEMMGAANANNPDDGASSALTKAFQKNAKIGSGSGKSDKEAAAHFARSAGKLAAKAGTAFLPPTLLRELANSRPDKQAGKSKQQQQPPQQQQQHRPARSNPTSPIQSRSPSTSLSQHHQPPPVYAATPPSDTTLLASSPDNAGYSASRQPPLTFPSSPSPLHSPQLGPPPTVASLPPQSVSAAGPHGRSILQAPRRGRVESQQQSNPTASPPSVSTLASQPAVPSDATRSPQSTTSQPASQQRPITSSNVVRFDPTEPALDSASRPSRSPATSLNGRTTADRPQSSPLDGFVPGRRRGSSASNIVLTRPPETPTTVSSIAASAPSSRRTSVDYTSFESGLPPVGRIAAKGKGKANGETKSGQSNRLPGLKDILGGLRREDSPSHAKDGQKAAKTSTTRPRSPIRSRRSTDAGSAMNFPPSSVSSSGSASPSTSIRGNSSSNAPTTPTPHTAPQYHQQADWREFKKGTYTYSISLPLPANLPPTIHADFGRNTYALKATVRRSGPLTPNLTAEREVVLVHAPDEEGTEETEAVVVERTWEDALTYRVFISGRSFACGSTIPLWMKFIPLGEKVKVWRLTATLEERTHYYAKGRKVSRHETPRKTTLLKVVDPNGKPLLPIISDSPDALASSQLGQHAIMAAGLNVPPEMRNRAVRRRVSDGAPTNVSGSSSSRAGRTAAEPFSDEEDDDEENEEVRQDALATLLDPAGPWELAMDLQVPGKDSRINITTDHAKSCITVSHSLRLVFRVERVVNGQTKLFDIVIEAPIKINHSHTAEAWLSLPDYWTVATSPDGGHLEGSPGDYFSTPHGPSRNGSDLHHRSPYSGSSSAGPATPMAIAAGPNANSPPSAMSSGVPSSWGGQTASPGGALRDRLYGNGARMATSPPPSSDDSTAEIQADANQWLALSISRNQLAGRTDRMVTFADGVAATSSSGISSPPPGQVQAATGELPPPYTVDDVRTASSGTPGGVSQRS